MGSQTTKNFCSICADVLDKYLFALLVRKMLHHPLPWSRAEVHHLLFWPSIKTELKQNIVLPFLHLLCFLSRGEIKVKCVSSSPLEAKISQSSTCDDFLSLMLPHPEICPFFTLLEELALHNLFLPLKFPYFLPQWQYWNQSFGRDLSFDIISSDWNTI